MKHVLIVALTMNASLAHAVGYMGTINVKISDPEQKVYIGSMIKKMEDTVTPYIPPVGQDLYVWGLEKYTDIVFDGARTNLSENIKTVAENEFKELDLSAYKNMDLSIAEFIQESKNASEKINAIGKKLKETAPESEHYLIDGITATMINQLSEKQISYLAHRAMKSEADRAQSEKQMYKLYEEKVEQDQKISSIEKRVSQLEKSYAEALEASKKDDATPEQSKKTAILKRQLEFAKALRAEELKRDLQSVHNIGIGIAAFIGLSNPALAQQITTTNTSIYQIGQSLIALKGVDAMSLSAFGHYGMIANASISLFQSWGMLGGKGKDGIGGALKAISKQISQLQERMDERFNRIENQLYKNQLEIIKNFAAVHKSLASINLTLENTYNRILQLQDQMKQTQINTDLKASLYFLEEKLTPIDEACLNGGKLKSRAVKKCFEQYTTFINKESNKVPLTRVGEINQWNRFYDYQVNHYAQSLNEEKVYSNPSILNEVKLRMQLLQKDYPQEAKQNITEKNNFDKAYLTAMSAVANFSKEKRNEIIGDTYSRLIEVQDSVEVTINDEFIRTHLGPYLDELKIIRRDYVNGLKEREDEITEESNRNNGTAGKLYVEDLQATVGALKSAINTLDGAIERLEKTTWSYQDLSGLPIIIKPKEGNAKPFIVSRYYLGQFMPELSLKELLITKMMTFEYDIQFKTSHLMAYLPKASGIIASAGGYSKKEIRQKYSLNGRTYDEVVGEYMMYAAQVSKIQLRGTFNFQSDDKLEENAVVIDITDSNQACKSNLADPVRRGGWFKNAPDPYSMLVMLNFGSFKKRNSDVFCWDVFKDAAKTKESTRVLQKIIPSMEKYKNRENNSLRASMLKGVTTTLNNNAFIDSLINLENGLAKSKGLLYLSPEVLINPDDKKIEKYLALPSSRIRDRFFGQLELYFLNDTGRPLADIKNALNALK